MWFDPFVQGRIEGRRYVPREGQDEYLHPDFLSGRDGDNQPQPVRVPRAVVVQLIVMATVMLAILVALILFFT